MDTSYNLVLTDEDCGLILDYLSAMLDVYENVHFDDDAARDLRNERCWRLSRLIASVEMQLDMYVENNEDDDGLPF